MKTNYNKKRALCTIALIAVNVAVFVVLSFQGVTEDSEFMLAHGAAYTPFILEGHQYYRLFTSMFLHFGFEHLMNNMVMLAILGWNLELVCGRVKYLLIYFLSGLAGNLLSLWYDVQTGTEVVSAGASGAIFGIIGALLYIAMRNRGRVGDVSQRGIIVMVVISLYYGFTGTGVDNFAHIGGLLMGFAAAVLLYRKGNRKSRAAVYDG